MQRSIEGYNICMLHLGQKNDFFLRGFFFFHRHLQRIKKLYASNDIFNSFQKQLHCYQTIPTNTKNSVLRWCKSRHMLGNILEGAKSRQIMTLYKQANVYLWTFYTNAIAKPDRWIDLISEVELPLSVWRIRIQMTVFLIWVISKE